MVNAVTVKALATRLDKAKALVADSAVFPVAGLTGYSVVKNGNGSEFYLVRHYAGHEHCSCPDYQQRQKSADLPCKHIMASQIVAAGDTPQSPAPVQMLPTKVDPVLGLAAIMAPAKAA